MSDSLKIVVEEFDRLLDVLRVQLNAAIQAAEGESVAVGAALQELASANRLITALAAVHAEQPGISQYSARIDHSIADAVVALQFQDRLSQRLGHIATGLCDLQDLLRDGEKRSCAAWLEMLRLVGHAHQREQSRLDGPVFDGPAFAGHGEVVLF